MNCNLLLILAILIISLATVVSVRSLSIMRVMGLGHNITSGDFEPSTGFLSKKSGVFFNLPSVRNTNFTRGNVIVICFTICNDGDTLLTLPPSPCAFSGVGELNCSQLLIAWLFDTDQALHTSNASDILVW